MSIRHIVRRQFVHVHEHGIGILGKKLARVLVRWPLTLVIAVAALPLLLIIRIIRPFFLVRFFGLSSDHLGHYAADTELSLCESDAGIDVPQQPYADLRFNEWHPISNVQLARMWRRVLGTWPSWLLRPIAKVNRILPGGDAHEAGATVQGDRDILHLLDRFPPHLSFTAEEEARGQARLRAMGIPAGAPYVCLIARDSAYGEFHEPLLDHRYHDYRNCDIQNFVLAAQELANRGYFVIRMGAKVREPLRVTHPRILDYATNGMRSDFMDVYLGATCSFCVSSSTGFDAIPLVFRRPIAFVNVVPFGWTWTFRRDFLCITRRHVSIRDQRELSLSEIFARGVGQCLESAEYESRGVGLVENTPEEIRDVVIEMTERLHGTWSPHEDDEALQQRFWEIFPVHALSRENERRLHGEIRSRFGAKFLRDNREWLR